MLSLGGTWRQVTSRAVNWRHVTPPVSLHRIWIIPATRHQPTPRRIRGVTRLPTKSVDKRVEYGVFRRARPCGTSPWCGSGHFAGKVAPVRPRLSSGRHAPTALSPSPRARRFPPLIKEAFKVPRDRLPSRRRVTPSAPAFGADYIVGILRVGVINGLSNRRIISRPHNA